MKKKVIFIFGLIMLLIVTSSLGFSNEYIIFYQPSNHSFTSETQDNKKIYKMIEKDGINNIYIEIASNNTNYNSLDIKEDELNDFTDTIKEQVEKEYNTNVVILKDIVSTVGTKFYRCIIYEYKLEEYGIYQKMYMILSDNYIYGITLTASNENYITNKEIEKFLNSIEIKDLITEHKDISNLPRTQNDKISKVISFAICGIIVMIISAIVGIFQKSKIANKDNNK